MSDSDNIFNFEKTRLKNELKNILSGKSQIGQGHIIKSISRFYRENEGAGRKSQKAKPSKEEEGEALEKFIRKNDFWFRSELSDSDYISEGAEQKVYWAESGEYVYKINDTIFYSSWFDYFVSIQIHNLLFPDTKYDYYNQESGIILEDLHDENVLTHGGIPFFIDSAIYLDKTKYKNHDKR